MPTWNPRLHHRAREREHAWSPRDREDSSGHQTGDPGLPAVPSTELAADAAWDNRLTPTHYAREFPNEFKRLGRIPLPGIDDIRYLTFEPEQRRISTSLSPPATNDPPSSSPPTSPPAAGGSLRRQGHRRHRDRQPSSPRRLRRRQRRPLPAHRPRRRPHPTSHHARIIRPRGSIFGHRKGKSFYSPLTALVQNSFRLDQT